MSFKKLSLGFSFLAIPTVVGSTAVACSCAVEEPEKSIEERIIDYFNSQEFRLIAIQEETYEDVLSRFDANYFRDSFNSQELANGFDETALEVLRLTDANGETLTDADFREVGAQFEARIIYNYGEFLDQVANVTISVEDNATLNLLLRIFETPYEIEVEANTPVADLYQKIDPEFIKQGLRDRGLGNYADAFDDLEFEFTNIQHRDDQNNLIEINANDLRTFGEYPADYWRFYYKYANFGRVGRVVPQARINIKVIAKNEAAIVDAINTVRYETTALRRSQYSALRSRINAEFIKAQLPEELQADFNDEAFSLGPITDTGNGRELTNADLTEFGRFQTQIHYSYGSITDQDSRLELRVVAQSEDEIVRAIKDTHFEIEITFRSEYETLLANIESHDDEFIKNQLPLELQSRFNPELFLLNSVIHLDGEELNTEDLINHGVIEGQIDFDYGSSIHQVANITINVVRYRLQEVLRGFRVRDTKNVPGFLDTIDNDRVKAQIEQYLDIQFENVDIAFDEATLTATSIVLKANEESDTYEGEITITWNLKLLEIWGTAMSNDVQNIQLRNGLKNYFYLEAGTGLVKMYDVFIVLDAQRRTGIINAENTNTFHQLSFTNSNRQTKNFTFINNWRTNAVPGHFGQFAYGNELRGTLRSADTTRNRLRYYSRTNHVWTNWPEGNTRQGTWNNLGMIRW